MKLSDKALLVQLGISQWTARKYDKRATEQVAQQNGSATQAGRYNKSLLPMNDALNNIHQKSTLIRKKFYANTLPWGIEGTMMLPSANYLNFMTEFRKEKGDWQLLVDTFYQEYPRLHADAQRFLGSLYNKNDYPALHDIQRKFKMDMAVFPVPSNDFCAEDSTRASTSCCILANSSSPILTRKSFDGTGNTAMSILNLRWISCRAG